MTIDIRKHVGVAGGVAGRAGAFLLAALIGGAGLGACVLNLWITFLRVGQPDGSYTDPLGLRAPAATTPLGDLGLVNGDFTWHGVLVTASGIGTFVLGGLAIGVFNWARRPAARRSD